MLSVLPAHKRSSPTQIVQKRSGRLIDRIQDLDRDRLEIIVSLQSCVFRLSVHGEINVRVSVVQTTVTSHVNDLPPSNGISVRPSGQYIAVLAYQAKWLFGNWDPSSCESSSNEIVQHVMSGRSTRDLFADKAVQTTSVDRRAASAKVRDTQVQPKT